MSRRNWSTAATVIAPKPPPIPCPHCTSTRPPMQWRSINQGDGSRLRLLICRVCSKHWRLILEPDESDE